MTAGRDKDRSLNSLQASHFLWETFKGGEEKDVNRKLPLSFLPSFLLQPIPHFFVQTLPDLSTVT